MPQLQLIDSATLQIVDTPAFNSIEDATYDYSAHSASSVDSTTQDQMMPLHLTGNNTAPAQSLRTRRQTPQTALPARCAENLTHATKTTVTIRYNQGHQLCKSRKTTTHDYEDSAGLLSTGIFQYIPVSI